MSKQSDIESMNFTYQPRRADINYCWKVSKFRYDVNKKLKWTTSAENDSLIYGFIGALGELAVSKIFGIEWEGAMLEEAVYMAWRKQRADLGPFEVKTISTPGGNLQLRENDKDFAKALLMYAPGSRDAALEILKKNSPVIPPIKLIGYIAVSVAKQIGTYYPDRYDPKKGKWVVLRKDLKDPNDLNKLIEHFDITRKASTHIKSGKIPPFRLTHERN